MGTLILRLRDRLRERAGRVGKRGLLLAVAYVVLKWTVILLGGRELLAWLRGAP